jgi:polyisoprenoid-binding protein YceI
MHYPHLSLQLTPSKHIDLCIIELPINKTRGLFMTFLRLSKSIAAGLLITPAFLFGAVTHANATTYQIITQASGETGIKFSIGYTAGTHHGQATTATGTVIASLNPLKIDSASINVPIANVATGDSKRDCHLREAFGLDYTKSKYPNDHVCDSDQNLPATGPDSVVFSDIRLDLESWTPANPNASMNLTAANPIDIVARVKLTIHGVTKSGILIPLQLTVADAAKGSIQVTGNFEALLSDYGVIVKKVLFIGVKDNATVNLDMTFEPRN